MSDSVTRFSNRVENYAKYRPTYPAAVIDILDVIRSVIPKTEVQLVDSKIMNQLSYTVLAERFKAHGFTSRDNLRGGVEETLDLLRALHWTAPGNQ